MTAAKLNVSEVFADTAVIGAIQASAITAAAVDAAVANFEFVESVNIASDAVTAGKIDVSSLSAISANLGTVNAGNINASQVSVYNLDGGNISSGTVPTARLDVAGIITAGSIIVSNDDISNLNNNAGFVDSSGAASAAPVQSVAGSTGNVSAQTIITAGGIAITSDIPTAVSELTNDSAFVNAAGAASAAPVQSVAGATGNVSASTIITAGSIAGTADLPTAVSELTNDSGYVDVAEYTPINTSFLHVVNETLFYERKQHLTEKIFKPIVLMQPFVLTAPPGCLNYLKSYGFKTFDQWWDESYDTIEDDEQRLNAVANIVNDICKLTVKQLEDLQKEMSAVLLHNRRFFYEQFGDICYKELQQQFKTM